MAVVGTISQGSRSLYFLTALSESGFVQEVALEVSEEQQTPGVNGRRWRTLYLQFPSFTLSTISEATTYAVASSYKNRADKLTNQLVSLSLTIAGAAYSFRNVHVDVVRSVAVPGPVVAAGSSGGAAHMAAVWSFSFTDFDQDPQAGT